jgi:hypothetical protein
VLLRRHLDHATRMHGFEHVASTFDPQRSALALGKALGALRRGESVAMIAGVGSHTPFDGRGVPFLGRSIPLAPGAAALARLSGAAVVPLECRLSRGRVIVEAFEPLPGGSDEQITRGIAGFFEARFTADPGLLWRTEVDKLLRLPPLSPLPARARCPE